MSNGPRIKLKGIGLFKETHRGSTDTCPIESMQNFISDVRSENEDKIIYYLDNSVMLYARNIFLCDVLNPDEKVALYAHLYTDGCYYWRRDLSYYVGKYHLVLPSEFIRHMESKNWRPPSEYEINKRILEL